MAEIILKILGASLVILSSTGIGMYFSSITKGRLHDLKDLKKDIYLLRGDIHYGNTPLPDAIAALAERGSDNFTLFFCEVSKNLREREGQSFSSIWDKGIETFLKDSYISTVDKRQLAKLGETLGYLDRDMQLKSIDLYMDQMNLELDDAASTIKEKTKLYNMLGVLFGLFLTIVMI